jgi:hypothetical protein
MKVCFDASKNEVGMLDEQTNCDHAQHMYAVASHGIYPRPHLAKTRRHVSVAASNHADMENLAKESS